MSISKKHLMAALLSAICLTGAGRMARADQSFDFNSPVTIGATQAPGVWYTDRYAPADFVSPTFFDGDNRLKHSIAAADGGSSRPGAFSSTFYDTQGRKYDLESGTVAMSIDLYIPADWATSGKRMAGFWGTAVDGLNAVSAYPIVEFTSDTATPRFRGYDNGVWVDMGLPTSFAYDAWQTLGIEKLASGEFKYTVGDLTTTTAGVGVFGSVEIDNVILQGHNTQAGASYDIHWDHLVTSQAPEPASIAMMGMAGVALASLCRRAGRRSR